MQICWAAEPQSEPRLEGFEYPFPVQIFSFKSQQQELQMAYMDLKPSGPEAGTIVLLHGKNFSGAYWEETARVLAENGFRVIMPDQIGFGKSSKPEHYQFTIHQLAANTHELLRNLKVSHARILGHSMGGMIAARYALMYPSEVQALILEDPLGLEDWKAKGVPFTPIDKAYEQELAQTPEKIRAYQLENYYGGKWEARYDRWVEMLTVFIRDPGYPRMAWNQALTSEMIYTQPVCYEFGNIKVPTLLIIGQRDRTAPGRNLVASAEEGDLGNYPVLGRRAAKAIPNTKLVEIDQVGHAPHIEAFSKFIEPLLSFLKSGTVSSKQ
ncbi:MAG: alpha/beta hydrolase [Nibricoccus sp.]